MDINEIKKHYKQLLKQYHPDTSGCTDDTMIKKVIEEYQKITKNKQNQEYKPNIYLEHSYSPQNQEEIIDFILECTKLIADNKINQLQSQKIEICLNFVKNNLTNFDLELCLTALLLMQNSANNNTTFDPNFEIILNDIQKYAKKIIASKNYLEQLAAINAPKQLLISEILAKLPEIKDKTLLNLTQSFLIYIICLQI